MRYICPPEGLKGESLNMKYDLWSVGVLIYYMIKGKYPFEGRRDAVVINQIESGINLKISDDAELNDLLEKTLEKDVNKRISWEDFFKHQFLTKEFPGKKKKTIEKKANNEQKEIIEKIINDYKNVKSINQGIRDYGNMIFTYGDKNKGKEFNEKYQKKLNNSFKIFDQILTLNLITKQ